MFKKLTDYFKGNKVKVFNSYYIPFVKHMPVRYTERIDCFKTEKWFKIIYFPILKNVNFFVVGSTTKKGAKEILSFLTNVKTK